MKEYIQKAKLIKLKVLIFSSFNRGNNVDFPIKELN